MNQNVKNAVSYVVIALVTAVCVILIVTYTDYDLNPEQFGLPVPSQQEFGLVPAEDFEETEGQVTPVDAPSGWTLVAGDAKDTCTAPTYEGQAIVHGWLTFAEGYGGREWLFQIVEDDQKQLPMYELTEGDTTVENVNQYVAFEDVPESEIRRIRGATPQQPVAVTVKGYSLYCEGNPVVSFEPFPLEPDEVLAPTEEDQE